jgi:SagB-type dehydrogenase family enzyme
MQSMDENIGDRFHQETKYHPERMTGGALDWSLKPELYKRYPGKRSIQLPAPAQEFDMTLEETLRKRKSVRAFSERPLTIGQVSYLLWASTGIQRVEGDYAFRTAPSAGALYPIETYLVANNVEGIDKGVYHYGVEKHLLEELRKGDVGEECALAALGQKMCATAPLVFIWTAIFHRTKWKYKERAYRYVYLDAGHIAGNLALAAVSIGLGSCQIGALYDDEVNRIIDVDGTRESTVYMSAVGLPL